MPKIDLHEGEEVEFKRRWTDQALEDLAAFANTRGGALFIGVEDNGDVVGVADPELEIQRIANTIASRLGLIPSVSRRDAGGRDITEVRVEPARGIIGLNGRYRTRVGSTNRDLTPEEVSRLILRRSGQSWDALPSPWGLDQVNHSWLAGFAKLARPRLPEIDPNEPKRLLQNLGLLRDGKLTNAAVSCSPSGRSTSSQALACASACSRVRRSSTPTSSRGRYGNSSTAPWSDFGACSRWRLR